ncbi:MAG: T9SS type A sorting domain-containing protein [Bacteroidia bacterium]|nr:T9SS type A sorting domain-containing protein [Bacteroidia bacterium]
MKKIFSLKLLLTCLFPTFSQTIILQEDFTAYQANAQTAPAGWEFSTHGNYTSSTYSGSSGPNSFKFGGTNTTINTPYFTPGIDSVSFWIKGSATDSISKLIVLESSDSLTWDTLAKICPLPTSTAKGKQHFSVKSSSSHLRFLYIKSAGNLAFDDFRLTKNLSTGLSTYNDNHLFFIYPNPSVDGLFSIYFTPKLLPAVITIYNSLGELVYKFSAVHISENINLQSVQPGIYFLRMLQNGMIDTKTIFITR